MKSVLRKFRDQRLVLALSVACLRAFRAIGLLRSRSIYSHVPFRGIVTVEGRNGKTFRILSRGHNIENGLYWEGMFAHEPGSMRLWVHEAAKSRMVLDIGANSGVFALAAAAAGAQAVHAFEPLPRVFAILEGNLDLNPELGVHAWPFAVGSQCGIASIFDPGGEAPTSASLSAEFASSHFGQIPRSEVRVVAIDEFCQEHGIEELDLIKIDVEGYEEQALRGMRQSVASSRPVILMEVLPGQEESLRKVLQELWPDSYSWSQVDEGPGHVSRNVVLRPLALVDALGV